MATARQMGNATSWRAAHTRSILEEIRRDKARQLRNATSSLALSTRETTKRKDRRSSIFDAAFLTLNANHQIWANNRICVT